MEQQYLESYIVFVTLISCIAIGLVNFADELWWYQKHRGGRKHDKKTRKRKCEKTSFRKKDDDIDGENSRP